VDGDCNEAKIADFICGFLKKNCPWLKVEKQKVAKGRFNVIAKDNYPTKLLVCGHLDTVIPRSGWKFNPLKPQIKGGKLYGLGALDMKGSLASFLIALKYQKSTKGLLLLFYIDEEYNFLGMRKFVSSYKLWQEPKLIFSLDGGDLKIGYACRGLIDIDFEVIGKSGHAAWPKSGKNAIIAVTKTVEGLSKTLKKDFSDPILGPSVCNLAILETDNKSRNVIPARAIAKLDIRPANSELKGKEIIKILKSELKKQRVKLGEYKVLNDLGPRLTQKESLQELKKIIEKVLNQKTEFVEPKNCGYGDSSMLYEKYRMPTASFGPRPDKMAHQANEYVLIDDLVKCSQVFTEIIRKYCP